MAAEDREDVEVIGFVIGNVSSAGNKHQMPLTIGSRECAAACLEKVGSGETLLFPHWKHALQMAFSHVLPAKTMRRYMAEEMKQRLESESKAE